MSDLTPGQTRALQYWGVIESATLAGSGTADLWQRINDQATALGYESAGVSAKDISALRSRAVGIRNARDALGNLGESDLITGSQIGQAPWARDSRAQNTVPMWQARFEHTFTDEGVEKTEWRTSVFTGQIPRSRAELLDALNEDAAGLADSYGTENGGVGDFFLLAI